MRSEDNAGLVEWYDKLSAGYDELYAREQISKYDAALAAVGPVRFEIAVDVACGTGLFLERLRQTSDFVVGVDVSRQMLDKARTRARVGSIGLVRADCARLPLKDGVGDCAFAISLLKAGGELKRQVSEMARVVKHEGLIVGTVFGDDGARLTQTGMDSATKFKDLSSRESLFLIHRAML